MHFLYVLNIRNACTRVFSVSTYKDISLENIIFLNLQAKYNIYKCIVVQDMTISWSLY